MHKLEEQAMSGATWRAITIVTAIVAAVSVLVGTLTFVELYSVGEARCAPSVLLSQWPKFFACSLGRHEGLAGALIAAVAALIAGWLAWSAVQQQIKAEERRASADRLEVERLLQGDMDWMAEAITGLWRVLAQMADEEDALILEERSAGVVHGIQSIAKPSFIATARKMTEHLGWERRRIYDAVLDSAERLREQLDGRDFNKYKTLDAVEGLASDVELARPETANYFKDFWRPSPKAWTVGYAVEVIAGLNRPSGDDGSPVA